MDAWSYDSKKFNYVSHEIRSEETILQIAITLHANI